PSARRLLQRALAGLRGAGGRVRPGRRRLVPRGAARRRRRGALGLRWWGRASGDGGGDLRRRGQPRARTALDVSSEPEVHGRTRDGSRADRGRGPAPRAGGRRAPAPGPAGGGGTARRGAPPRAGGAARGGAADGDPALSRAPAGVPSARSIVVLPLPAGAGVAVFGSLYGAAARV